MHLFRAVARIVAVAGGVIAAAASAWAQVPAPPAPTNRPPLVLDVRATDPVGRPLVSLSPADVVVEIDGQVSPVLSSTYVAFAAAGAASLSPAAPGQAPADPNDRALLVVLDDLSFDGALPEGLADAVARWIVSLGPKDAVGVMTTSGRGAAVEPTRDKGRAATAVQALLAGRTGLAADPERTAVDQVNAVFGAVRLLHRAQGTRAVVMVSAGLASDVGTEPVLALRRTASQAGARIYAVVPGAPGGGAVSAGVEGLQLLAAATGGRLVRMAQGTSSAFTEVLADLPGTIRLTLEAPARPADGPYRTVKLTARDVATLLDTASRVPAPEGTVTPGALDDRVRAVLRDGEPALAVPVESAGVIARDEAAGQLRLINTVTVPGTFQGPLSMTFVALDERGGEVRGGTGRLGEPVAGEYRTSFAISLAPGRYRLRVAVVDALGHLGVADRAVVARLRPIGSLTASDPQVVWRGDGPPWYLVSRQTVPMEARAMAVGLELFADAARTVADAPAVALALTGADGRELARRDLTATPMPGGWRVTSEIALEALPPGGPGGYDVSLFIRDAGREGPPLRVWVRRGGDSRTPARPSRAEFLSLFQSDVRTGWPRFDPASTLTTGAARRLVQEYAADVRRPVPAALGATLSAEAWAEGLSRVAAGADVFGAFARAILALARRDLDLANTALLEAGKAAADSASVGVLRAAWHAVGGRDRDAIEAWRDAIGLVSADPDWTLPLAEALGRTGDFDGALEALGLLPRDPSRVEAARAIDAAVALGRFDHARTLTDQGRMGTGVAQPRLAFYTVVFAYADALDSNAGAAARQRFMDVADRFIASGSDLAPLVRAWVESLQP